MRRESSEAVTSKHINQVVKHPVKVMFWGCFSSGSPGRLHICEGMVNSDQYCHIIDLKVAHELQQKFPDGDGVFQHDLAPSHTSKKTMKKLRDMNINVLDWPGNSPDVNPIENLWAIVKYRLESEDTTTKSKLISAILHIWNHDEDLQKNCVTLVHSMLNRVRSLIKAKGAHIKY